MTNSGCSLSKRPGLVLGRGGGDQIVPPGVASVVPADLLVGAPDDEHAFDRAGLAELGEGVVDRGLQGRRLAPPVAAVGRDDQLGAEVRDPAGERVGREPAEHDGVRCPDARAGEHRHHRLGDHRQVDRDPVAGPDAERLERVRGPADLVLELGVGDVATVAGLAHEVNRDLVPQPALNVPVDAVVGHVQLPAGEPPGERRVRPVEDGREVLGPGQAPRGGRPEGQPVPLARWCRCRPSRWPRPPGTRADRRPAARRPAGRLTS